MGQPLQLVYFNENTAGEGFFQRMSALQNDPQRAHVLERAELWPHAGGPQLASIEWTVSGGVGQLRAEPLPLQHPQRGPRRAPHPRREITGARVRPAAPRPRHPRARTAGPIHPHP